MTAQVLLDTLLVFSAFTLLSAIILFFGTKEFKEMRVLIASVNDKGCRKVDGRRSIKHSYKKVR